ncbi:hypothetical protein ACHAWF_015960 [Thalassiosira exigua]
MAPRGAVVASALLSRSILLLAVAGRSPGTGARAFSVVGPSCRGALSASIFPSRSRRPSPSARSEASPSPLPLSLLVRGGSRAFGTLGASASNGEGEGEEGLRTGWLHRTEPKPYYSAPAEAPGESSAAAKRLLVQRMDDFRDHRIIGPPAIHPCGDGKKRLMVTEHRMRAPLDHPDLDAASASPSDSIVLLDEVCGKFDSAESFERQTVDVYFTILELVSDMADEEFAVSLSDPALGPRERARLYLRRSKDGTGAGIDPSRATIYLQGGPGFGCAAPVSGLSLAGSRSSWASTVLFGDVTNVDGKSFDRIVLMDQRGTGRSSPISKRRLKKLFPDLFLLDDEESSNVAGESAVVQLARAKVGKAVADATAYLSKFRADSIVRDAEWIREAVARPASPVAAVAETAPEGGEDSPPPEPWGAALGQSFGGFCLMTYLSSIARPPRMCLFTGGIAPMDTPAREVYDRLWLRVKERSLRYYEHYPGDVAEVKRIVRHLLSREASDPVRLPSGGILTARRFLQLGLALGGSPGSSFANLHSIVSSAFLDDDEPSNMFLKGVDDAQSFDDAPLYFLLHESIYADGPASGATEWAAHSSYEQLASSAPEFDYRVTSSITHVGPTLFFGEMVFPWMAHGDYADLSGRGMRGLSEALATKSDWLPLYDATNARAARLKSKGACATYFDDMYVDFDCSMKLLKRGGALDWVKPWVTNEHQHSGLRDDGASVVGKLASMAKGSVHVPS